MMGKQPERRLGGLDRSIKGGCSGIPFIVHPQQVQNRERHQAINPGGAGAKPLQPTLASSALLLRATSHNE
jgi:hypothetical protein